MTFAEICAIEPRITTIIAKVKPARFVRERFLQYGRLKRELSALVGWHCSNEKTNDSDSYLVVINELCGKLNI